MPSWSAGTRAGRSCSKASDPASTPYGEAGPGRLARDVSELEIRALDPTRELGARVVCVQTALWNYDAVRFYARVGYRTRGVFAEYLGTGNDLVWLDKALPPSDG